MKNRVLITLLAFFVLPFFLCSGSCSKEPTGYIIPGPNTGNNSSGDKGNNTGSNTGDNTGSNTGDNTSGNTGGNTSGNTGGNTGGETPAGTLCTDIGQTPVVVAYYTEYSKDVPDAKLLTHVNYAHGRFVNPKTGDGGITIAEPSLLKKVVALKKDYPHLKVLLMIGGWGSHADGFSMMARDPAKRTLFCKECKKHIDNYGLDGIDIDWEYPTYAAEGNGASPDDKANFVLVLKELRETIGTDKLITFASSSSAGYMNWKDAIKYIDYVNVMTYDMGRPPERHNSPLYRSARFSQTSDDEAIDKHVSAGIPKERLVLGVPFYGKSDKDDGTYSDEVKFNEMDEILTKGTYKGKSVAGKNIRYWDPVAKVPYLGDAAGKNYLSYDDAESVAEKGKYVAQKGILGAMFWEYRHDDGNHTLLKSLVTAMYGQESVIQ